MAANTGFDALTVPVHRAAIYHVRVKLGHYLATTKGAATTAYLLGQRAPEVLSMTYERLVDAKMDNLNMNVQEEFRHAREACQRIAAWVGVKQPAYQAIYERIRNRISPRG